MYATWRRRLSLPAFLMVMGLVFILAAVLVWLVVSIGRDINVLSNAPIEVTAASIVQSILGIVGLVGVTVTYWNGQFERRATKARFVFNLNHEFFEDAQERAFFYKLDHGDFNFEHEQFAKSDDEKHLDKLLYRLSFVGKLLKDGVIEIEDVGFVAHIVRSTLKDEHVINYLDWLHKALPEHRSFADAIYLFEKVCGRNDPQYTRIRAYLS